jgi:hypothetical protein
LEISRDALEMQWRQIGEIGDTVEIGRDTFEIQMPAYQRTCPAGRPKPKWQTESKCLNAKGPGGRD